MKTEVISVMSKPKIDNFLTRTFRTARGSNDMGDKEKKKNDSEDEILNLSVWSENEVSEEGATSNSSSNTTLFAGSCLLGVDADIYNSIEGDSTLNGLRVSKKPIPEDLKDPKYFERRRRNNMAAKKSRDARKLREDQIITRVGYLEQENAILRTQTAMMREELRILQIYQIQKRQSTTTTMSQVSFPSSLLPPSLDSLSTLPLPFSDPTLPINASFNQFSHFQMQSPIQFLLGSGVLGSSLNSEIANQPEIPKSLSLKYAKEKI